MHATIVNFAFNFFFISAHETNFVIIPLDDSSDISDPQAVEVTPKYEDTVSCSIQLYFPRECSDVIIRMHCIKRGNQSARK
jgi:hypothetical protein